MFNPDDDGGPGQQENRGTGTAPWWELPAPAWWDAKLGPWPPPLKPGETYGSAPGSVNVANPPTPGPATGEPSTPNYDIPNPVFPKTPTTPGPGPGPGPAPGPTGGGSLGDLTSPFTGTFTPPTRKALPGVPTFTAPEYTPPPAFTYDKFVAPTAASVLGDPGYAFARDEGLRAIEQSKAASGVYNTGGTLKDLAAWNSNYAGTRYNDAYGRDLNTYATNRETAVDSYNTNYQTQYADPYKHAYQGALDAFAPQLVGYTTQAANVQRENELDYRNAFDLFDFDWRRFVDQRDSTFNKRFQVSTA